MQGPCDRRLVVTDRNSTANTANGRRAYARPSLTIYGSVRELTGAMSGTGTDNNLEQMNAVNP